jgi:hypothetical protein
MKRNKFKAPFSSEIKPTTDVSSFEMEMRHCKECGAKFKAWVKSTQKFCSRLCVNKKEN